MKREQEEIPVRNFMVLLSALLLLLPSLSLAQDDECNFAEEAIRIGVLAPLSAPGAVLDGVQIEWVAYLAADHVNAACGIQIDGVNHRVEAVSGDSEGLPERGQAAVERLIFDDGIVALIGGYHSAVGLATMGILHDNEVPAIYASPWNDNITANGIQEFETRAPRIATHESGVDYIFRTSPSISLAAPASMNWLLHLGVERVVIIAENTDYGIPAANKDKELLVAGGLEPDNVDIFHIELGQEDFLPLIDRILARPEILDAVMVEITGETMLNFTQQMAESGLAPNEDTLCALVDETAYKTNTWWSNVPDGNYCAFFRVGIVPALYNEMSLAVVAAYFDEYQDEITSYALATYDAFMLMVQAIQRAGSLTDGPAIVREIEASDVILTQGHYYFKYGSHNPDLGDDPAWMWHQWPDPAVTMMQYFIQGQPGPEAAVVWPPAYWTHGTADIPYGTVPGE